MKCIIKVQYISENNPPTRIFWSVHYFALLEAWHLSKRKQASYPRLSLGNHFTVHATAYVIPWNNIQKSLQLLNKCIFKNTWWPPERQAFLCLPGTLFLVFNSRNFSPRRYDKSNSVRCISKYLWSFHFKISMTTVTFFPKLLRNY